MRIHLLALDGVFDLGLSAALEAFQTANELNALHRLGVSRFDTTIVGVRRAVRSSHGFRVPLEPLPRRRPDCLFVPAIGYKTPEPLGAALARPDVRDAAVALRTAARGGAMIAAACVGTFVLAESGLLDGEDATTTWWLAPFFRQRYPDVRLEDSRMIVPSGRIVTAGAALSHIDLALWLIRGVSPELAALTAKYLIVDARASQSAYALSDHRIHSDAVVQRFERWVRSHLGEGFTLDHAAAAAGASKRTLARRVADVLGTTPLRYVQSVRIERALHLLRTTDASVDDVATQVGYADGTTLRLLLRKRLGIGLRELRHPA